MNCPRILPDREDRSSVTPAQEVHPLAERNYPLRVRTPSDDPNRLGIIGATLERRCTSDQSPCEETTTGDSFVVIMAAYQTADVPQRDFNALVEQVKSKSVRTEGVILVERAADGEVRVTQTGDHLGRKGMGWGGGVGVLVGLFSPPCSRRSS